jgi:hypothetical protein
VKNYDETRQALRRADWSRGDITENGVHKETWWAPNGQPYSYEFACSLIEIEPAPTEKSVDPRPPYRRKKTIQSKHLDTRAILEQVAERKKRDGMWTHRWDLQFPNRPEVNERLVLAKIRRLLKEGLLDGCGCGCRGDLELTPAGYAFLGKERRRDDIKPGFKATADGRALRDLWWEGGTMCVQFDDTGEVAKFVGAYATNYSFSVESPPVDPINPGEPRLPADMFVSATIKSAPIEFIPITFTIPEK